MYMVFVSIKLTDRKAIIMSHEDILHKAAKLLLEKEKISGQEFDALFKQSAQLDVVQNY